jgi:uncharacterized SAM-binding protein YcdF (DUF218 family)
MFLAKKLITYWILLPPGNIVLFLALLSIYLFFKKLKRTAFLTLLTAVGLYLLSIKPTAVLLINPLENRYSVPNKIERNSCKAVVILGGGIKIAAPFLDLKNDLMEDAFKRVTAAVKLYQENPNRIFIVSGFSVKDNFPEAEVMKDYLTYMGIPEKLIYPEGKSRDTFENAKFVYNLLKNSGVRKVCLITSAYHMPRSVLLFTKVGFKRENIVPVPVDYKGEKLTLNVYNFLPTAYWLNISAKALHEYFGLIYYKLLKH